MSNPRPPIDQVDPSEGAVEEGAEHQSAQAAEADDQDDARLNVDPSEEPTE